MAWYLKKHTGSQKFGECYFGVFYALSGYMAAYSWNIMWLDCIVLLPLILHLLNDGEEETCIRAGYYRRALTIYRGILTHEETSAVQGKPWVRPEEALGISGFRLDPAPLASDTHSTHFYSWAEDGGAQTEHSS